MILTKSLAWQGMTGLDVVMIDYLQILSDGGMFKPGQKVEKVSYFAEESMGPAMVGCLADAAHQGFLDTLWSAHTSHFTTDYYDSELQLLPMLVAAGHWWMP